MFNDSDPDPELELENNDVQLGAGAALESDLSGGGGDNMDLDSDVENGDEEYFTADSGDEEGLLESESDDSNDSSDSSDSGSDFDPEAGPVAIQHLPIPNQLNEPLYNDAPLTILQHVLVVQHHFLRFRVSRRRNLERFYSIWAPLSSEICYLNRITRISCCYLRGVFCY